MVRWALLVFLLSLLISQNAIEGRRGRGRRYGMQGRRYGMQDSGRLGRGAGYGTPMYERKNVVKPPKQKEESALDLLDFDARVYSAGGSGGRKGFADRYNLATDYNVEGTDYSYETQKEILDDEAQPKDMQNVVEGLLQKYKGSKPVLIGIPYPVVYEIHANPINPPTVQIGTIPDYARHGSHEENSSPNLNRPAKQQVGNSRGKGRPRQQQQESDNSKGKGRQRQRQRRQQQSKGTNGRARPSKRTREKKFHRSNVNNSDDFDNHISEDDEMPAMRTVDDYMAMDDYEYQTGTD